MITMSEPILDRLLHLPENQIPMIAAFLESLPNADIKGKNVSNRIGVAKNISFPANFDDIDYGTEELFGLNT